LLCFADLHATDGHERCHRPPHLPLQLWRVNKFFEDLRRIYDQYDCDGLVDLGDTTDDRSAIPVPALDAVMAGLNSFPASEFNYKLVGNHEQYVRDGSVNTSELFSSRFKVIEDRAEVTIEKVRCIFAAFPKCDTELAQWLNGVPRLHPDRPHALLGHIQVLGSRFSSGPAQTGVPAEELRRSRRGQARGRPARKQRRG